MTHNTLSILRPSLWTAALLLGASAASAAIPDGYYGSLEGKKKSELKKAAKAAVKSHTEISYSSGTWSAFETTDTRMVNGKLAWWDMYSPNVVYVSQGHPGMNVEHSVPNSLWGGSKNAAYKDLFHLNPSDSQANSWKSNYPLGIVEHVHTTSKGVTYDNGVTKVGTPASGDCGGSKWCYEPADEYKGDFARTYFYMFTVYDDIAWQSSSSDRNYMFDGSAWPSLRPWAYEMLLEWAANDPVDQKEIDRNEAIYKVQHNRNPFIDIPDLAEYIWGSKTDEAFYLDENHQPDPNPEPTPDPMPDGVWCRVKAQSEVAAGAQYILVAPEGEVAMDYTLNKTYMEVTGSVAIEDDIISSLPHGTAVLTLEEAGGGRWYIHLHDTDGNSLGYLDSTKAKTITLSSTPSTSVDIEASASETVILYTGEVGKLLYNASAPRFTTYTSNQKSVQLFRLNASTGVEEIQAPGAGDDGVMYDLYGRRVMTEHPVPGIYVRGGRKIIIR